MSPHCGSFEVPPRPVRGPEGRTLPSSKCLRTLSISCPVGSPSQSEAPVSTHLETPARMRISLALCSYLHATGNEASLHRHWLEQVYPPWYLPPFQQSHLSTSMRLGGQSKLDLQSSLASLQASKMFFPSPWPWFPPRPYGSRKRAGFCPGHPQSVVARSWYLNSSTARNTPNSGLHCLARMS